MEIGKLAGSLPAAEDIVRALGLQQYYPSRRNNEMVPSLALFGAGVLVGAGLALLLAPTTGRELREEITERATELRDRVAAAADEKLDDAV
jgi:hypothetical protein